MERPKVLVIDDDKDLISIYRKIINPLAQVDFVYNLSEGLNLIKANIYDFILIDLYIGDEKSTDWLEFHKETGDIGPEKIILVTGKGNIDDEIKGHELGLRDYFRKPLNIKLARTIIDKHLNSLMKTTKDVLVKGPFEIDLNKQIVTMNADNKKIKIDLTLKEYLLFKYFLINEGRILKRENLIEILSTSTEHDHEQDHEGGSRSLDMHISCLRKKLGHLSHIIKTRRSLGYLMELNP